MGSCRIWRAMFLGALPLLAMWALSSTATASAGLPREARVPGGIAILPLKSKSAGDSTPPPLAWLGEQRVLVVAEAGRWVAVTGLALDTAPGEHELRVEDAGETRYLRFVVSPRGYPEQRIALKDTSKVQLSATDLARVEREVAAIQQLKKHWREADDSDLHFIVPAEGRLGGRFGLRRFFNGEPRSPHSGFDIAAARGTVVRANSQGVVLAVGDYFFNGKTVFIDHGNGLISMYCHLDRIDVVANETVRQRQPLGTVGMTGRATGPHLHWGVILNGALVNPELFVAGHR